MRFLDRAWPKKYLQPLAERESVTCPLCGGTEFTLLATTDRYRMGIHTSACKRCNLIMTNPMPTVTALANFYKHHYRKYYHKREPSINEIRRLGMDVRAVYTAKHIFTNASLPVDCRILDVGCGYGVLLEAMREYYPRARLIGVEPGASSAELARKYVRGDILTNLEEVAALGDRFDLIIVNHVLEHVRNPVLFLRDLLPLLNSNGMIYVDVPDATRYNSLESLHIAHLYHFTVETLEAVLKQAGLTALKVDRHSPPHHPDSIFSLARPGGQDGVARVASWRPGQTEAVIRILAIGRTAWKYHLTNLLPIGLLGRMLDRFLSLIGLKRRASVSDFRAR